MYDHVRPGDRPIEITLDRAWRALSLAQRVQLLWALVAGLVQPLPKVSAQEVERLKDDDMVNMYFSQVGHSYPEVRGAHTQSRCMLMYHTGDVAADS